MASTAPSSRRARRAARGGGASASARARHPRDRIHDAALELFYDRGFHATTVRDIMGACDLTPGALYNHYGSKEDILYELVTESHNHLDTRIDAELAEAGEDPRERLRAVVTAFARFHSDERRLAVVGTLEYRHLPEAQRREVINRRLRHRRLLERILADGVEQGLFSLPPTKGGNTAKVTATALANVAMRLSEAFGPDAKIGHGDLAAHHAELALHSVLRR
jgi:AcrR family transcriptional regulator